MGIYKEIEAPVRAVVKQLVNDPGLQSLITYKKRTGRSYDETEKVHVTSFKSYTIKAVRLRHTDRSKLVGFTNISIGDQLYLIDYRNAPSRMSQLDEIVDEFGQTQDIQDITNIFNLAVAITVKGGSSDVGR